MATLSDERDESSKNESIRVVAIFFGAVAIGLLSFTHDTYSNRTSSSDLPHKVSDDVADTLLLLALIFSLSVAALRRPRENTRIADSILNLSFLALVIGTMVFVWANLRRAVAICLTISLGLLVIAYLTFTDPNPHRDGEGRVGDKIAGYWAKYRGLAQPTSVDGHSAHSN